MYLTKFDKYMSNTSQYTQIPVREEYTPFSGGINPTPPGQRWIGVFGVLGIIGAPGSGYVGIGWRPGNRGFIKYPVPIYPGPPGYVRM